MDPNRWESNANLAEMDLNAGDLKGAYPYLDKLQQINPDSPVGNFLMARYWFAEKQYAQARVYAEKARDEPAGQLGAPGYAGRYLLPAW